MSGTSDNFLLVEESSDDEPEIPKKEETSVQKKEKEPIYHYVTYMSNDRDLKGVCVLNHCLKKHKCKYGLVCVITERVSPESAKMLTSYEIPIILINERKIFESIDMKNIDSLLEKGWFGKLNILGIHQIFKMDKIVYLDADTFVVNNIDHLFECATCADNDIYMCYDMLVSSAEHDYYIFKNAFNSGVFIFRPNSNIYSIAMNLLKKEIDNNTLGRDDQYIFNLMHKKKHLNFKELSFAYNLHPTCIKKFMEYGLHQNYIFHFYGEYKPYLKTNPFCWVTLESLEIAHQWKMEYITMLNENKRIISNQGKLFFDEGEWQTNFSVKSLKPIKSFIPNVNLSIKLDE